MKNNQIRTKLKIGTGLLGLMMGLSVSATLAQTTAIINAKIFTGTSQGVLTNGTIVIDGKKIIAVGNSFVPSPRTEIIDAKGKMVTVGLIAANSELGFSEVSSLGSDLRSANDAISASFDVHYGFNPRSQTIPVARAAGTTRAIALPEAAGNSAGAHEHDGAGAGDPHQAANLFGGLGAVVDLSGSDNSVTKTKVAAIVDLGTPGAEAVKGSRGVTMTAFQGIIQDVRHYAANRSAYERGEGKELRLSAADLEALIPIINGQIPLVVNVHRASDIARVIDLAKANRLKIIINGGGESWLMAAQLADAQIPVILDTTQNLPEDFDRLATRLDSAAILSKAGVKIIITGEGNANHRVRENRMRAGMAVANGMAYDEAIKSLTLYPAQAFGLSDLGSIEAGKLADLVIWSDDPLEMLTKPEIVFINGKRQDLTSRATQLADRYKYGTEARSVAYPKP